MVCCGDSILASTTTPPPPPPPVGSNCCLRTRYVCVCVAGVDTWVLDVVTTACVDPATCVGGQSCTDTEFVSEIINGCICGDPLPPLPVPTCDPHCCSGDETTTTTAAPTTTTTTPPTCAGAPDYTGTVLTYQSTERASFDPSRHIYQYDFVGVYVGGGKWSGTWRFQWWQYSAPASPGCFNEGSTLTLIQDDCFAGDFDYNCSTAVDPGNAFYFVGLPGAAAAAYAASIDPNCSQPPIGICTIAATGSGVAIPLSVACTYNLGIFGGTRSLDYCEQRYTGSAPSTCISPIVGSFNYIRTTESVVIAVGPNVPPCTP